jgi:hypothetical protein
MSSKTNSTNGIGLGSLVFLVFLVLKLTEIGPVADWSWWWVTSPLWIPIGLFLTFILIAFIIAKFIE